MSASVASSMLKFKEPQDRKNDSSWSDREWAVEYNTENRIKKYESVQKLWDFFYILSFTQICKSQSYYK